MILAKKENKRLLAGALALAVVAAIGIRSTLAYLTDTEQVTNTFTVGNVDIDVTESAWNDGTNPDGGDGEHIEPGDVYYKDPLIHGSSALAGSSEDAYVRVKMLIKDTATGRVITDGARYRAILNTIYYDPAYSYDPETKTGSGSILEAPRYEGDVAGPTLDGHAGYTLAYLQTHFDHISPAFALDARSLEAVNASFDGDAPAYVYFNYIGTKGEANLNEAVPGVELGDGTVIRVTAGTTTKEYYKTERPNGNIWGTYAKTRDDVDADVWHSDNAAYLFTAVCVPTDYTNEDMELLGDYSIELTTEAIQKSGFGTADAAFAQLNAYVESTALAGTDAAQASGSVYVDTNYGEAKTEDGKTFSMNFGGSQADSPVRADLAITVQPGNAGGAVGSCVTFTAAANGESLKFQWQRSKDGGTTWADEGNAYQSLTGTTAGTSTLTFSVVSSEQDGHLFRCIVTDAAGHTLTTGTAVLTVTETAGGTINSYGR